MSAVREVAGALRRARPGSVGSRRRAEPSAALFHRIRLRLALWYSGVLALILLASGLVLYVGVRHSLLDQVDPNLRASAAGMSQVWQRASFSPLYPAAPSCTPGRFDAFTAPVLYVCYDGKGRPFDESRLVRGIAPNFSDRSLAQSALQHGEARDTVTMPAIGAVRWYALRVPGPAGGTLGSVAVGESIGTQLQTLDTLLQLMLLLGALTVLMSAAGGLFLAGRALAPAHLAYARQREFIADASHELRTPLTMLRSGLEVVLRGRSALPPEDIAVLEDSVEEASHLASLANSMLDVARLDGDGLHLEEDVVDLSAMAADVARWAAPLAAEREVEMYAQQSEPVIIVGDRSLLEQAVMTLIDNAIKYNRPHGEVRVHVWEDSQGAHIEVRDTGIGIESAHLSRLGERFYRVDKARSRASGGAGLGLSIARRIVDRHGGSVHIDSEPGQGTTAVLSVPAARVAGNITTGERRT